MKREAAIVKILSKNYYVSNISRLRKMDYLYANKDD